MHGVAVNKYLQLFRTGNAVMGIVGVAVASFMAAGTDIADAWVNLLISAVVVFMFICGGNALNDYIDYEIDKTAHPERPIPSGRMTRKAALYAALVMLGGSVVVSFLTIDLECILIVVVASGPEAEGVRWQRDHRGPHGDDVPPRRSRGR